MIDPQNANPNSQFERYGAGGAPDLTEEISSRPLYPLPRQQRSGLTPMDTIDLEGMALTRIAQGRVPGWVAIASWFVYGIPTGILAVPTLWDLVSRMGEQLARVAHNPLSGTDWFYLILFPFLTVCYLILCVAIVTLLAKGTIRKLRQRYPKL